MTLRRMPRRQQVKASEHVVAIRIIKLRKIVSRLKHCGIWQGIQDVYQHSLAQECAKCTLLIGLHPFCTALDAKNSALPSSTSGPAISIQVPQLMPQDRYLILQVIKLSGK